MRKIIILVFFTNYLFSLYAQNEEQKSIFPLIYFDINKIIRFNIELTKFNENTFSQNEYIGIKCTIINTGNIPIDLYLKDHHDYHGALDFPTSFFITIENMNGEKLIEEYTPYYYWNTKFKPMIGDWILLPPNENIIRHVNVRKMILSAKGMKNIIDLIPGEYFIRITIKYNYFHNLIRMESNKIKIRTE
jgi:hypothetical protein